MSVNCQSRKLLQQTEWKVPQWSPQRIFKDKSEWRTARIYIFVYRNRVITGSRNRNSRFLAVKRKWSGSGTWTEWFLSLWGANLMFWIHTIEQICGNPEVGNEMYWLGLENMYTNIWFLWVRFQAGMISENISNALLTASKLVACRGMYKFPLHIVVLSVDFKARFILIILTKMQFLFFISI